MVLVGSQLCHQRAYVIATTPRSGSYHLCELLWCTGICGQPTEYVRKEDVHVWQKLHRCNTYDEYIDFFLRRGWSRNGIFGAKLMWHQFVNFTSDLAGRHLVANCDRADIIRSAFGDCRYIFLQRRDKLRQAISYYKAQSTGTWNRTRGDEEAGIKELDMDATKIFSLQAEISKCELWWEEYLSNSVEQKLTIFYEDLAAQPAHCISAILEFLDVGLEWDGQLREGELLKLSDESTERWVKTLRAGLK